MDNVIEFSHTENKILSDKEKKFVHGIISGLGKKQAALEAGYAETSAHVQASRLLKKDKILRAVSRARSLQMQQTVHTLDKEIDKLDRLYEAACTKKQLGAAVQAARLKAQLLGYLVEKKEVKHSQFDTMSEDDLIDYLDKLKANYGGWMMRPAALRRQVEAGGRVLESLRLSHPSSSIIHHPSATDLHPRRRSAEEGGGGRRSFIIIMSTLFNFCI